MGGTPRGSDRAGNSAMFGHLFLSSPSLPKRYGRMEWIGMPGCPSGNDSSLVIGKGKRGARVSVRYRAPFGLPIDYVRGSLFLTERAQGGRESLTQCCLSVHGHLGMRAKCFLIDVTCDAATCTNKKVIL